MSRHEMFQRRLRELGVFDEDSDYDGMIGEAVEQLSATFATQRHSEGSMAVTLGLFSQLFNEYNNPESPMWRKVGDDG